MTNSDKSATLLRIYVRESETWEGTPLYRAIVDQARTQGLAGATVLRGIEGFGLRSDGERSAEPPLVLEIVDWEDKTDAFLASISEMVGEGLATTQRVDVALYRSRAAD